MTIKLIWWWRFPINLFFFFYSHHNQCINLSHFHLNSEEEEEEKNLIWTWFFDFFPKTKQKKTEIILIKTELWMIFFSFLYFTSSLSSLSWIMFFSPSCWRKRESDGHDIIDDDDQLHRTHTHTHQLLPFFVLFIVCVQDIFPFLLFFYFCCVVFTLR